jgi:hypothetical protein
MDVMRLPTLWILLASLVAASGCGDDCGSVGRFTDKNGLTVLVVCGQTVLLSPTPAPTATPTPRS